MHLALLRGRGNQLARQVSVRYRRHIEFVVMYWLNEVLDQARKNLGQTTEQCRVQRKTMPRYGRRDIFGYLQLPSNMPEDETKRRKRLIINSKLSITEYY